MNICLFDMVKWVKIDPKQIALKRNHTILLQKIDLDCNRH